MIENNQVYTSFKYRNCPVLKASQMIQDSYLMTMCESWLFSVENNFIWVHGHSIQGIVCLFLHIRTYFTFTSWEQNLF